VARRDVLVVLRDGRVMASFSISSLVQDAVLEAYDAADEALRLAQGFAPAIAPDIRKAVDALFAARVALDEDRS
jgi:hypothetical protein